MIGRGLLIGMMLLYGCSERPDGEDAVGDVQITASASVDGEPVGSGGITASDTITVSGTMTDPYGVAISTYSWQGGSPLPLTLDAEGRFELEFDLGPDDNALVLEGTSVIEGSEPERLELSFVRDAEPPTIELPNIDFAATIRSEDQMELNKQPTSFTLSGGVPIAVRNEVAFSKYTSTYGVDADNRPTFRFNLADNHDLVDATMEFRILRTANGDDEILVDWTSAERGEQSTFEVTVDSTLHEAIGLESGVYRLRVRAKDSAGLEAEPAELSWTQTILNPPIYLATANESQMAFLEDERNPSSYVLDVAANPNFDDILNVENLAIGAVVVGNPNPQPVLVRLTPIGAQAEASYKYVRRQIIGATNVPAPPQYTCPRNQMMGAGGTGCFTYENPVSQKSTQEEATELLWEIYDASNTLVTTESAFVIPQNTQYLAVSTLAAPMSNIPAPLETDEDLSGVLHTYKSLSVVYICILPSSNSCFRYDLGHWAEQLESLYATWEFSAKVESKVQVDLTDETPFEPAHDENIDGYTRVLAASRDGNPPDNHDY